LSIGPYLNERQIRINTFEGGLNTKVDPSILDLDQSPALQNVVFDDLGSVKTNNGFSKLTTSALASAPIDGMGVFSIDPADPTLFAVCNSSLFGRGAGGWDPIAEGTAVFTSTAIWANGNYKVHMHNFQNMLIMGNQQAPVYKYTSGGLRRFGVSATAGPPGASSVSDGTLTGTYTYVFTGVNSSLVESDVSDISGDMDLNVISSVVRVSGLATAPLSHGINSWNVYRNTAGASGIYYLVTSVTNGTTSFIDNNSDAALGAASPTDKGSPRKWWFFTNLKGRLFMAGEQGNPSYLWYSETNTPELVPSTNFIPVGDGDGMFISGLNVLENSIIISKSDLNGQTATYILYVGDSSGVASTDNWYLTKSDSPEGSESHACMTKFSNVLTLFNRSGIFAFTGRGVALTPADTSEGRLAVDTISFNIEGDINALDWLFVTVDENGYQIGQQASAVLWKNKVWFTVNSGTSSPTANDTIYIFDFNRASKGNRLTGGWTKFTGHNINDFVIWKNNLYGGSSLSNGFVYKLDSGTDYDGSAINSIYTTAPIYGKKGEEESEKVFRFLRVSFAQSGAWDVTVEYAVDFGSFANVTGGDITLTSGSGIDIFKIILPVGAKGKLIQFRFSTNTADEYFNLKNMEVMYKPIGREVNTVVV